jgi:hypothetical protein
MDRKPKIAPDPALAAWVAKATAARLDAEARLADTLERIKRAEQRRARSIELAAQSQKCVVATFDLVARRAIAAMYAK